MEDEEDTEHSKRSLFLIDLQKLLSTLEGLCYSKINHIDYVKAYKSFIDTWGPDRDYENE